MNRTAKTLLGAMLIAAPAMADPLPPGKGVTYTAPEDGRFELWWTIDDAVVGGSDAPPAVSVDLKEKEKTGPHKPVNEDVNDYHYSWHLDENLQTTVTDVQAHNFAGFDAMSGLVSDTVELYTLMDTEGQNLNVDVDLLQWWTYFDQTGGQPLAEETSFLVTDGAIPELPGWQVWDPGSAPFTGVVTAYGNTGFSLVPSPGTLSLLALGLGTVARRRRNGNR